MDAYTFLFLEKIVINSKTYNPTDLLLIFDDIEALDMIHFLTTRNVIFKLFPCENEFYFSEYKR